MVYGVLLAYQHFSLSASQLASSAATGKHIVKYRCR